MPPRGARSEPISTVGHRWPKPSHCSSATAKVRCRCVRSRRSLPASYGGLVCSAFRSRPIHCDTPSRSVICATIPASWSNSPACSAMSHLTPRRSTLGRPPTTSLLISSVRISMSTADRPLNASQRRRIGISADPSEDELAQDWSLSPADLREISHCRGADHKRRYALQLCMLRAYGRFLDDHRQAPLRIVNHLSRQLGLPPVLFLGAAGREPTEREQAQRIRRYLGLAAFDHSATGRLRDWLRQGAAEGCSAAELLSH